MTAGHRSREQLIEEAQAAADAETLRHFAEREAEAVRLAVLAEREACAALVDSWPLDSEPFGSREFPGRVFEAVDALAGRMRARGQK